MGYVIIAIIAFILGILTSELFMYIKKTKNTEKDK